MDRAGFETGAVSEERRRRWSILKILDRILASVIIIINENNLVLGVKGRRSAFQWGGVQIVGC